MPRSEKPPAGDREVRVAHFKLSVEKRGDKGVQTLVGHAATFDAWTTLYDGTYWRWREVIRPGAFANAIRENQDVISCVNHDDDDLPLGRTTAKTLRLAEDKFGLAFENDLPTYNGELTECARDLVAAIECGNVTGMSFAFTVRPGGDKTVITNEGGKTLEDRELLDVNLHDVSYVTRPAYTGTDVAIRSRAQVLDTPPVTHRLKNALRRLRLADASA